MILSNPNLAFKEIILILLDANLKKVDKRESVYSLVFLAADAAAGVKYRRLFASKLNGYRLVLTRTMFANISISFCLGTSAEIRPAKQSNSVGIEL